jgi:hypothetical protein
MPVPYCLRVGLLAATLTCVQAVDAAAQTAGAGDISLWPGTAALNGQAVRVNDPTAAGGAAVWFPDKGIPKLALAAAQPASYVEMTFDAQAGIPYRLWLRLRGEGNSWQNESVYVQFSGSVTAGGAAAFRIGTTEGTSVNLEEASGAGISGWGWQDNGYGAGVLGPTIYFAATGAQTVRVQQREDGVIIDQILLSPSKYMSSSPGTLKNDTVILPSSTAAPAPNGAPPAR